MGCVSVECLSVPAVPESHFLVPKPPEAAFWAQGLSSGLAQLEVAYFGEVEWRLESQISSPSVTLRHLGPRLCPRENPVRTADGPVSLCFLTRPVSSSCVAAPVWASQGWHWGVGRDLGCFLGEL